MVLETVGCSVEQDQPEFAGASETRLTLCCVVMLSRLDEVLDTRPDQLDWRIKRIKRIAGEARKLSAEQVLCAEEHRGQLWRRMCTFFERYDYLAWPVNPCNPYRADDMHAIDNHDWLMQDIQPLLGLPSISVPGGFASDGSPVGLQITGRRGDDLGVLQLAHAYECETGFWRRRPPGM